jgi:integrase/recombinase XerD
MSPLAPTLQAFFTDRLIRQRQASPHTVAAYRDTCRMLLTYAAEHTGVAPSRLDLAELDAPLIAGFLDHLEHQRRNSIRTRNARLAAITHCSVTPHSSTPNTRRASPECWRSHRNAATGP